MRICTLEPWSHIQPAFKYQYHAWSPVNMFLHSENWFTVWLIIMSSVAVHSRLKLTSLVIAIHLSILKLPCSQGNINNWCWRLIETHSIFQDHSWGANWFRVAFATSLQPLSGHGKKLKFLATSCNIKASIEICRISKWKSQHAGSTPEFSFGMNILHSLC